jgi:hypothetical protein
MKSWRKGCESIVLLVSLSVFFSVLLTGCSYVRHDRESLNKFATAYISFRQAVKDSEVVAWAIELDQSERTDGSNGTSYRRYFAGALDTTASNRVRADSAREAVEYHDSNSTKWTDDFDSRIAAVDEKSLALVEAANAIRSDGYRPQAVAIAESARKIQHTFDTLREDYVNIYDLQVVLLNTIAKENGDLGRALRLMQQKLPDQNRLEAERDKLLKDEQESLQRLQEQYAAFKGTTGTILDYVEPPASNPR